jgi:N-acetylated-alpha-linked acidic dipeptidase
MRSLITIGTILPALSQACQRDFPDQYTDPYLIQSFQHLSERAAEPFPPVWSKNEQLLHEAFDNIELETWASYYTHGQHLAGRNKSMAEETSKKWNSNGVPASLVEYEVFLNYPVSQSLVLNMANGTKWKASLKEDALEQDETTSDPNGVPAFHGYSANGEVEAEYVYVG